jgi:hypothetical protein
MTKTRPLSAEVRQGAFLSILEVLLARLVVQLQDKKSEKDTDPA